MAEEPIKSWLVRSNLLRNCSAASRNRSKRRKSLFWLSISNYLPLRLLPLAGLSAKGSELKGEGKTMSLSLFRSYSKISANDQSLFKVTYLKKGNMETALGPVEVGPVREGVPSGTQIQGALVKEFQRLQVIPNFKIEI
jgi:hypothetical protein